MALTANSFRGMLGALPPFPPGAGQQERINAVVSRTGHAAKGARSAPSLQGACKRGSLLGMVSVPLTSGDESE